MTPRLNSELALRFISALLWYKALAACTSPSSNFAVPCSKQRKASISAGSDAVEWGVTEVAQPRVNF